ncbi:MAG: hypothetical protein IT342_15805 [Candidatus Melainabacteria bacterium]|nr:hypothetical protein [Candidatus Melainabacteria bacterium]
MSQAITNTVAALCLALVIEIAISVRRTAGDAVSDIWDVAAEEDVCKALSAENKLVGLAACRFLVEV